MWIAANWVRFFKELRLSFGVGFSMIAIRYLIQYAIFTMLNSTFQVHS